MTKHDLVIHVEGDTACLTFGKASAQIPAKGRGFLPAVATIVASPRNIASLKFEICNASFSTTRQISTMVNVLALELGVRVNGKKQWMPKYDREPNITTPLSR